MYIILIVQPPSRFRTAFIYKIRRVFECRRFTGNLPPVRKKFPRWRNAFISPIHGSYQDPIDGSLQLELGLEWKFRRKLDASIWIWKTNSFERNFAIGEQKSLPDEIKESEFQYDLPGVLPLFLSIVVRFYCFPCSKTMQLRTECMVGWVMNKDFVRERWRAILFNKNSN